MRNLPYCPSEFVGTCWDPAFAHDAPAWSTLTPRQVMGMVKAIREGDQKRLKAIRRKQPIEVATFECS
jgi:hypothetical protein